MAEEIESSGYRSIQLDSLPSMTITTRERFKLCCRLSYKPRLVKNKGAILVLLLNFFIMSFFGCLAPYINPGKASTVIVITWLVGLGFAPPIAGWLADAHVGRYKIISWSIWIMWIASVLATVSSVIAQCVDKYHPADSHVFKCLIVVITIGLGGYQANIIQFGIDQLSDASTAEITSFIIWYAMTIINGGNIIDFVFACLSKRYDTIRILSFCLNVTLALVLMLCFNHWLIKEPVKQNPFQLVYTVVKYAIKNKHPRCRSAFTYCEDDLPSRIDFGKSKYGGPFTTEQVEDVKTVLRLIPMMIIGGAVAGVVINTDSFRNELCNQFTRYGKLVDQNYVTSSKTLLVVCYSEASYTHTFYYSAVVLIVIHEVLFFPVFQRCSRIQSIHKVLIGIFLQIIRILTLMAYDIVSRQKFLGDGGQNISCLLSETQGSTLIHSFDYRWIAIPDTLHSISLAFLFVGGVEFLSAQAPYFMKGLIVGTLYCSICGSSAVWFGLSVPFHKRWSTWSKSTISCGFWYTLMLVIVQTCILLTMTTLRLWYKKRRRQDVLPNEHFFAERYYSTNN